MPISASLSLIDGPPADRGRAAITAASGRDEDGVVNALLAEADPGPALSADIVATATRLVEEIRARAASARGLDAFLHQYSLSNHEGVVLMCLAEALLRIPDAATIDRLIADKIGGADWRRHLGQSDSLLVNASTWALMLTGRLLQPESGQGEHPLGPLKRLVARSGESLIRQAMLQAMRIVGRQFVMGRTIEEALERARAGEERGYRHSFDMLGESVHTAADARQCFEAYRHAIEAVGRANAGRGPVEGPGISLKLSALRPRFEFAQRRRLADELVPRVLTLARQAKEAGIGLCVDTEEAERLEPTLDVFAAVFRDPSLAGWEGLGLAVQAYQKRARPLVEWLARLAAEGRRRIAVRLVKGAYWDAEIKRAQELGLDHYPVFTRKVNTDVSYIACVRRLLAEPMAFYPAFATHNAHTLATVLHLAGGRVDYEFQRLHGMGESLYDQVVAADGFAIPCRVYAPVGSHESLLAYLVRRLLENGSNTSFVNRVVDAELPVTEIVADPVARAKAAARKAHPRIPLPRDLFGNERLNSRGLDLSDPGAVARLADELGRASGPWSAAPIVAGQALSRGATRPVRDPADHRRIVGHVNESDEEAIARALAEANAATTDWRRLGAGARAALLDHAADLLEGERATLIALLVREAGKTLADAVAEAREAADFCRYYAMEARRLLDQPSGLPGPTGERNELGLHGRGVFACISPWNFPLAIFVGQVAAALVAGNAVIAKPAPQTPLIAAFAVRLLHRAGVPESVLHLLPGSGGIAARVIADPRIAGVAFTGSLATARAINQTLARREGAIVPLVAETGGQNAMIVDSTALPEQVAMDVVTSAFRSAGQRCSALRVLFLQREIAPRVLDILVGAMAELAVGDPGLLATDIGPIIDEEARARLRRHVEGWRERGRLLAQSPLDGQACAHGTFFPPHAIAIDRLGQLTQEVFGPVVHVVEFERASLDQVIDSVNDTGYGLTAGVHSRSDSFIEHVRSRLRVGNLYINRNMIGAVVGVQPFGGEGLSGTGPKAGGPHYLSRFVTERTVTVNVTATGGNAELLSLAEDEPTVPARPRREG